MSDDLLRFGWNTIVAQQYAGAPRNTLPARVIVQQKTQYVLVAPGGEYRGVVAGRMRFGMDTQAEYPVVGDWVVFRPTESERRGMILEVLPRRSKFSRQTAGREAAEQVVAANIDVVFLVQALDENFTLRGLERYLILASGSGARPVVVLNKADLSTMLESTVRSVVLVAGGIPVHTTNAKTGSGLEDLRGYLDTGITGALLGPSGVGKSTIINRLLGHERLRTRDVRAYDGKGRHTTSHRELVALPSGGLLIDTPGMRELSLWEAEESVEESFEDIEELAARCRFRDCRHDREPGCAVCAAVEEGTLDHARLLAYHKLHREIAFTGRKVERRGKPRRAERGTSVTHHPKGSSRR